MRKKILLFILSLSLVLVFGDASALFCYGRYQQHVSRRRVCQTVPGRPTYAWRYVNQLKGYKNQRRCTRNYRSSRLICKYVRVPVYRRVRRRVRVAGRPISKCRYVTRTCCVDPRSRKRRSCF